jgi:hypothetical protein
MIGESAAEFASELPYPPRLLACASRRICGRRGKDARRPRSALDAPGPPHAHDWPDAYERFWIETLDRLADYLTDLSEEDDTDDDGPTGTA